MKRVFRPEEKPLLLVDRDGTLIEEGDYLKDPARVRFLPRVFEALRRLKARGFFIVVVSNQSGVGRRLISRREARSVAKRFETILRGEGIRLDGFFYCPHLPSDRCPCRKPKLGLVRRAARALERPWRRSLSIGDRASDVLLGQRTGGWGILVKTGYGRQWLGRRELQPDYVARDFASAASWILKSVKG
jgi:D-glycero-D-manno-heptose 1,7-bisphosphate phosphatase